MTDDEFRRRAGFTDAEAAAWFAVRDAARAVMALESEMSPHPSLRGEFVEAFHNIQSRLLSRPMLRALYDDDPDAVHIPTRPVRPEYPT